jgi:hypothetical protein
MADHASKKIAVMPGLTAGIHDLSKIFGDSDLAAPVPA